MNAPLRWPQMPERVKSHEIHYPETDGKAMAESDLHRDIMFYLIRLLQRFFAGQPVYVSGNLLVYYEKGNRDKSATGLARLCLTRGRLCADGARA